MNGIRVISLGLMMTMAGATHAQSNAPLPRLMNEATVNARWSRDNAVELGWGFIIPTTAYLRTTLTAAGGYVLRDERWMRESRYEATMRFLLDPFRQSQYGLSFAGGIGMTNSDGLFGKPNILGIAPQRWRPYLVALADLELRKTAGLTPAVQLGIGSGIRAGFVVRSATNRWR